jgi:hypothetical protein
MHFNSRPYFFVAALLVAAAAHAESGGSGMGHGRVHSDSAARTAETAPDTDEEGNYADGTDAQAATPSHREGSAAAQQADHGAKKSPAIMVAPAPQDPEQQRIWTAP